MERDVASALEAIGLIARSYPPSGDDVASVLGWLPLHTEDGKPLTWTRADVCRLIFARRLRRTGRLTDG